jgi:hypothetical protein
MVFFAPIFLASSEDMTFVSSSSVKAQNISIFAIFSLFRRDSSVAEPFRTIVFSNSFDNTLHRSLLESISLRYSPFQYLLLKKSLPFHRPQS